MDSGNEWARTATATAQRVPDVWVRVWFGDTAVEHYRCDLVTADTYVKAMRGQFPGVRYTIDPLPSFAPPTRPLPVWHLDQTEQQSEQVAP